MADTHTGDREAMPKQRDDDSVHSGDDLANVGGGAENESGTGDGDQPTDERSGVYTSLVNLVKHHGAQLAKNERVYELGLGEYTVYVVANSPGAAAMKWIVCERVTDKAIVKAAFEAMKPK